MPHVDTTLTIGAKSDIALRCAFVDAVYISVDKQFNSSYLILALMISLTGIQYQTLLYLPNFLIILHIFTFLSISGNNSLQNLFRIS